ncbi:Protein NRT1/ PTR FAMILY 5.1 [Hibiscus syriacus]|uniref:Protein NRT1/ PTR FAMILY 5.1 n=1 Tax=Hibiscus syriacus TaxID=106335 RepID=A0A6A2WZ25_HIBSY|nr:protein NRT1/ PTR FAMILY 5.2-like [Hibiscus syriacus]KAE8660405.1 Protein NRT1/ PTR FAMILY 5.1 [Hibiscus syriacus]
MSKVEEERGSAEEYTEDGSVDLKGRPVLRSNTGRWKACSFIVGYEVFERMAYYGIASNLVLYLTNKLHEGTVTSANNVNNWVGTVWMTPILGAYIADAHLGRYWTFVIASAIYLTGMSLLTLAVSVPALRPPSCGNGIKEEDCNVRASLLQKGLFYCALYIIAIGTGGTKPNISTMGADQFDDFEPKERVQKLSFFNWWMFSIFFGTLFSNTFLIYIQDNVGWNIGYGLPTVGLMVSILVFLVGTPYYRHKLPLGSFTRIFQVLVAAVSKWNVPVPSDPKELHELSLENYSKSMKFRIDHTPSLRFLDKAAVKRGPNSPWMLCPVTQVEETKRMAKMIPILTATFIPSTMLAQVATLFVKQGTTLDLTMGPHFKIPPACLTAFVTIFMLISIAIYDRLFVPTVRRYTKNPRGITLLQRMGIGLVLQITVMITACFVERKRISVARENHKLNKDDIVPLSIFILLPQFALMGVADSFAEVAKIEFFYDQAPDGMKSLGTSYFTTSLGVGHFLGSFILTTVSDLTKRYGHRGWILNNLNISRIDYYYALLASLGILNFIFFLFVANSFVYNTDETQKDLQEAIEVSPDKASPKDPALEAGPI